MRGERWALVSVKLALLFLRTCSRRPIFACLFSCAECTCIRSHWPVYTRSFSPARVRVLALTPGTSHSPRARCSRSRFLHAGSLGPRFLRAGPSQPRFLRIGTFAASLFACRHFCGLALRALALCGLTFRVLAPSWPRFSRAGSFAASPFARLLFALLQSRQTLICMTSVWENYLRHRHPPHPPTPPASLSVRFHFTPLFFAHVFAGPRSHACSPLGGWSYILVCKACMQDMSWRSSDKEFLMDLLRDLWTRRRFWEGTVITITLR